MLWSRLLPLCLLSLLLVPAPLPAAEIHTAAHTGDLTRVTALVDSAASLAVLPDHRQCFPIHFAVDGGHLPVMDLLEARGADLMVRDVDGDTPLHWAAIAGQRAAAEWLLERQVEIDAPNHHEETPLLYAVRRNQYETVELLASRGADLEAANDYERTPLLWVARERGNLEMAGLLLRLGADVNARDRYGDTPLSLAAWRGFRVLVGILMDHGAVAETEGELGAGLLTQATSHGLDRLYQALVAGGIELEVADDADGRLLHQAAGGGSRAIVRDLIERGAAVDAVDDFGWTPLHYAAARGRREAAAELLAQGAAAGRRTRSGRSALNLAEQKGAAEVVELLAAAGAEREPRRFPVLAGPYLGQELPGEEPEPFAVGIVATPFGQHGNITFSADGRLALWSSYVAFPDSGYYYCTIHQSRLQDGSWTAPQRAPFAREQGDDVPFFAPAGDRLFFASNRPLTPGQRGGRKNLWVVDRVGDDWGEPRPLAPAVNRMPHHWQISVAASGNLYFSSRTGGAETAGIYVSRPVAGEYTAPEFLGFSGGTPYVAPDESYLITSEHSADGSSNLIRFRQADGGWGEPVAIVGANGARIGGLCPMISPDGRCFFWLDGRLGTINSWWVKAGFIAELERRQTLD